MPLPARISRPDRPTVLIVEDEWLVARHVQACLQAAGFDVPAPVHGARAAVETALRTDPDVIVMDVKLDGDADGITAACEIGRHRQTPVVYLTAHSDRDTVTRAAYSQVAGYVLKPFVERQLISAVLLASLKREPVAAGHTLADKLRAIASVVNDGPPALANLERPRPAPLPVADRLSPRERELVELLAQGARLSGVARRLGLSHHTVRNHLKSVFRKLGVHSQHELTELWHARSGPA